MEMRPICEKCNTALPHNALAFVCSYECTFCAVCSASMHDICPNCQGELVRRPRRALKTDVTTDIITALPPNP